MYLSFKILQNLFHYPLKCAVKNCHYLDILPHLYNSCHSANSFVLNCLPVPSVCGWHGVVFWMSMELFIPSVKEVR